MRIDVSEVKSFRECKRKWAFSSRNMWHLRPRAPKPALAFGTLFHEGLHTLYLSGNLDKALETTLRELSDPAEIRTMTAMLTGYANNVLRNDLEEYKVLDIEHMFELEIPPFSEKGIVLCGSIDMLAVTADNVVWGFEHKSCGRFRDPLYTAVDEQPRLYTVALKQYIDMLNMDWASKHDGEYGPYTLGGIFINEVRKVQRSFDHRRTPCTYTEKDLQRFMDGFYISCSGIVQSQADGYIPDPEPGYLKCSMCDFKEVCDTYKYNEPVLEDVLDEFSEELMVRDIDHLDEKLERSGTEEDV